MKTERYECSHRQLLDVLMVELTPMCLTTILLTQNMLPGGGVDA